MDAEEEILVWKGSRAKGFDQLGELVAVSWEAFEKGVGEGFPVDMHGKDPVFDDLLPDHLVVDPTQSKCASECLSRAASFEAFLAQECLDTFPCRFVGQFKSEDGRVTNDSIDGQR